jgi:hypothetical protein
MNETKLTPPAEIAFPYSYFPADRTGLTNIWQILDAEAGAFKYRRTISRAAQKDLLRYCAAHGSPVYPVVMCGNVYFYIPKTVAGEWLNSGGRRWIVAELERRSSGRVVAFRPNRNGPRHD